MELRRTNRAPRMPTEPWDAIAFGLEVRRLRRARRLTVRAIKVAMYGEAARSMSSAWKLEQGFRSTVPAPAMLRSLAAVLGTTEAHLLRFAGYGVACACGRCPRVDRSEAARARIRAEVMGAQEDEEE